MFVFVLYLFKQVSWFCLPIVLLYLTARAGYVTKSVCYWYMGLLVVGAVIFLFPKLLLGVIIGCAVILLLFTQKYADTLVIKFVSLLSILFVSFFLFVYAAFALDFDRIIVYDTITVDGHRYTIVTDSWIHDTLLRSYYSQKELLYDARQPWVAERKKYQDWQEYAEWLMDLKTPSSTYYDSDQEYFENVWLDKP